VATVGTTVDLAGVNELIAPGTSFTSDVLDQLFLELLAEQPDYAEHPPTFAPALAERYEVSADRRIVTFHLRRDAVWSDGVPITAEDVRFTWQAQIDPGVAWAYADSKDAIADVEVVDPHTVRFHFSEVYPYQLVDANDGKILPKHLWSALPFAEWPGRADWFREHLAVSGPYRLAGWQPGQEVVLERNDRAPRDLQPLLDRVRFRVVPDQPAHVEQLLAGAVDFVAAVPPEAAARVAASREARLEVYASRQYDYVCWNTLRPPFDDPAVRRALTLAIDRQSLVDALWHGYAKVGFGPIPGGFWARHRELSPWPYDPAEARRILAAAGFADGDGDGVLERGGKPFRFELTTNSSNRLRGDALVMIQEQLRRIGVAAEPRALEIHALTERNIAHDFEATLSGWAVDTTLDLRPYFHSSEAAGGYNFGAYRNPELDRLLESVRHEPDLARAMPVFARIQEILHRDQPYTFLWEPQRLAGVRRDLRDVAPNALSAFFNLPRWWRAPAAPAG
jgi:peptide/nickel transport system substrate-binding protein